MTPDTDPSDARRRKGKPTTIDLTATAVPAAADTAQSEPASGPAPAPESEPSTPVDPAPVATVDTETEALAAAGASERPDPGEPAQAPASSAETPSEPVSEVTGERFSAPPPTPSPSAAPETAAEPRRGGFGLVAAAVIGGIIGLGGSALLVSNGVVQPPAPEGAVTADMLSAVDQRVGDLDQRVARMESAPAPQPDAGLVGRVEALEQRVAAAPTADPDLARRLTEIEASLATPQQPAAAGAALSPDLDALKGEVADLSKRLDGLPQPAADPTPAIAALTAAVDQLKTDVASGRETLDRLAAAPAPVDPARVDALEKGVSDLVTRIAGLEAGIAGLKQSLGDEVGGVRKSLDDGLGDLRRSLGDEIAGLKTATGAANESVSGLTARVGSIEERLDAGPKGGEIAALSLAVTTLSSRIAEGAPFAADLAVVEKTAPDLPEVAALKPIAEAGVDSIDRLAESMPVDAIMAARPVTSDAGVLDRVFSGAKSLVNYRETGPGTEDPASKAIDEMRAALAGGDAGAALTAADGLPDWAKPPAADWLGRLSARATADAAVHALTAKVLDRLQAPADGR